MTKAHWEARIAALMESIRKCPHCSSEDHPNGGLYVKDMCPFHTEQNKELNHLRDTVEL